MGIKYYPILFHLCKMTHKMNQSKNLIIRFEKHHRDKTVYNDHNVYTFPY